MKKYLNECWTRAKECIVLIPFVVLPLLCYGVARGSEADNETQGENYFLPDTTTAVAPPQEEIEEKKEEETSKFVIARRGTVYNPRPNQCQGDPWKTATDLIDSIKLHQGKIRWVALSSDLEAKIPMHSRIKIYHENPKIAGIWEVKDRCGKSSTIDFLRPWPDTLGLWKNIRIEVLRRGK